MATEAKELASSAVSMALKLEHLARDQPSLFEVEDIENLRDIDRRLGDLHDKVTR